MFSSAEFSMTKPKSCIVKCFMTTHLGRKYCDKTSFRYIFDEKTSYSEMPYGKTSVIGIAIHRRISQTEFSMSQHSWDTFSMTPQDIKLVHDSQHFLVKCSAKKHSAKKKFPCQNKIVKKFCDKHEAKYSMTKQLVTKYITAKQP